MIFRKTSLVLNLAGIFIFLSCSGPAETTFFPETCAEIQEQVIDETGDRPNNGSYTLYIDGDESKPWDVYCHNMSRSTPKEYLEVDPDRNFSQFSGNGITTTEYRRIRIDPIDLKIDLSDDTFADTFNDDEVEGLPDGRSHFPLGWAQYGDGTISGTSLAEGSINFAGTNFVMTESVLQNDFFCTMASGGDSSASQITIESDLGSVEFSAINTIPSLITKTVADCDNMGDVDENDVMIEDARLPVQYVSDE